MVFAQLRTAKSSAFSPKLRDLSPKETSEVVSRFETSLTMMSIPPRLATEILEARFPKSTPNTAMSWFFYTKVDGYAFRRSRN
mmetsp:Transcript_118620/g.206583  ORF Transcript_118620/g.206583 Transcript_118620/m.206583 type:complete len:83 (-) Transcript_118620:15-263(-)